MLLMTNIVIEKYLLSTFSVHNQVEVSLAKMNDTDFCFSKTKCLTQEYILRYRKQDQSNLCINRCQILL